MIAGLFQLVIGFSGVMGLLLRFIGPLTVIPTITLVALPLFETAYQYAGEADFSKIFCTNDLWRFTFEKR